MKTTFWKHCFENNLLKALFWKQPFESIVLKTTLWKHFIKNNLLKTLYWKQPFENTVLKTTIWKHCVFSKQPFESTVLKKTLKNYFENSFFGIWHLLSHLFFGIYIEAILFYRPFVQDFWIEIMSELIWIC